jgi:hypothetical protein
LSKYLPYSFLAMGAASASTWRPVIQPWRKAIYSTQATFRPWRSSMV